MGGLNSELGGLNFEVFLILSNLEYLVLVLLGSGPKSEAVATCTQLHCTSCTCAESMDH